MNINSISARAFAGCAILFLAWPAYPQPQWDFVGANKPTTLPLLPASVATPSDGQLYLIGAGSDHTGGTANCLASTSVARYYPLTDTYDTSGVAQLPTLNRRCDASAITGPDGRIYVIGGREGMGPHPIPVNTVLMYDTKMNSWTVLPGTMTAARSKPAVAVGSDHRIYVFGGVDQFGNLVNSAERMDVLGAQTWSAITPFSLPAGDGWRAATDHSGRIHLFSLAGQYLFDSQTFSLAPLFPSPAISSAAGFSVLGAQDGNIHHIGPIDHHSKFALSLNAYAGPFTLPSSALKLETELAEGSIFAAGNDLIYFNPVKANVGPNKIRWRFDNSNVTVPCNPGAAVATNTFTPGRVNAAASFNGTQLIKYNSSTCFNVSSGSFSIDFWIRPQPMVGLSSVIDHRDPAGRGYHVALSNGKIVMQINLGGPHFNYTSPGPLPFNQWTHVAVTVFRPTSGAPKGFIWFNGAFQRDFIPALGNLNNTGAFLIGAHSQTTGARFKGDLDDLQIHPLALTWHQVRAVFLAGREGKQ